MSNAKMRTRPRVGPGRLSAADAAGLEDRLLDAAFLIFAERGFGDATMDQIAQRAGASTKTIYSRFANKSEILEAVVRRNVQRAVADHLRAFALTPESAAPREYLMKFGMQIASATDDETVGMTRITFAESYRFPVLRRLYREVTGRGAEALGRALHVWRDAGALTFGGDAQTLGALLFSMMTDVPRVRAAIGDPLSSAETRQHVANAVDVFLRGCASKVSEAQAS